MPIVGRWAPCEQGVNKVRGGIVFSLVQMCTDIGVYDAGFGSRDMVLAFASEPERLPFPPRAPHPLPCHGVLLSTSAMWQVLAFVRVNVDDEIFVQHDASNVSSELVYDEWVEVVTA